MSYNGPTWKFGNLLFRVDPLSCRCQIDLNPERIGGTRTLNSNPGFSEDIYLILINQVPRFRPWSDNAANQWGNPYRICQINPYFPNCRCKAKIRSCLPCNLARHLLEWYWYKTWTEQDTAVQPVPLGATPGPNKQWRNGLRLSCKRTLDFYSL